MKIPVIMLIGLLSTGLFSNSVLADLSDGLVAYYPFDGNANDKSSNGNDGTVNGAILKEDRFGNSNSAYYFDGVNDKIALGDTPFDFADHNFSISLWAKWEADPRNGSHILDKQGYPLRGGNGYRLMTGGSGEVRFELSGQPYSEYNTNFIPSTSTWYHLVVVVDSDDSTKVYIDSQNYVTAPTRRISGNQYDLTLGKRVDLDKTSLFSGEIDDLRIYNRTLSDSEVQQLYKNDTECSQSSLAGTVSSNLDIHAPSLDYQSLLGTQNIWADFEFYGENENGELLWKLKDYGVNK